jgi:hypothetical protein
LAARPALGCILDVKDFEAITNSALKLFDERMAAVHPDNICREFDMEVARLESRVVQLYGMAALLAQLESELEKAAEIWGAMISVCDIVGRRFRPFAANTPSVWHYTTRFLISETNSQDSVISGADCREASELKGGSRQTRSTLESGKFLRSDSHFRLSPK